MDLDKLRQEKAKALNFKDNLARVELIKQIEQNILNTTKTHFGDVIEIEFDNHQSELIQECAIALKPWRKGPFRLNNLFIDSEWQSNIKYNLLSPYFDLKDKVVADIGCNNGYYMFRMREQNPREIIGFDPGANFYLQFLFINLFAKTDIKFELLGVEHLPFYEKKFDFIFMLGVLYHRSDPVGSLKSLAKALNKSGEIIIDTFMIDGDEDVALSPASTYSKIPNIYFVPTVNCLRNWLVRAGFCDIEILAITKTDANEQRKTDWIDSQSLEDFLDPNDPTKTVEGYPAPKRVYVKAKLKS